MTHWVPTRCTKSTPRVIFSNIIVRKYTLSFFKLNSLVVADQTWTIIRSMPCGRLINFLRGASSKLVLSFPSGIGSVEVATKCTFMDTGHYHVRPVFFPQTDFETKMGLEMSRPHWEKKFRSFQRVWASRIQSKCSILPKQIYLLCIDVRVIFHSETIRITLKVS